MLKAIWPGLSESPVEKQHLASTFLTACSPAQLEELKSAGIDLVSAAAASTIPDATANPKKGAANKNSAQPSHGIPKTVELAPNKAPKLSAKAPKQVNNLRTPKAAEASVAETELDYNVAPNKAPNLSAKAPKQVNNLRALKVAELKEEADEASVVETELDDNKIQCQPAYMDHNIELLRLTVTFGPWDGDEKGAYQYGQIKSRFEQIHQNFGSFGDRSVSAVSLQKRVDVLLNRRAKAIKSSGTAFVKFSLLSKHFFCH